MTTLWQIINQIKASNGLGNALGTKPCRGCEKRAQWLNKPVPFLLIAGSGFLLAQAPRKPLSAGLEAGKILSLRKEHLCTLTHHLWRNSKSVWRSWRDKTGE